MGPLHLVALPILQQIVICLNRWNLVTFSNLFVLLQLKFPSWPLLHMDLVSQLMWCQLIKFINLILTRWQWWFCYRYFCAFLLLRMYYWGHRSWSSLLFCRSWREHLRNLRITTYTYLLPFLPPTSPSSPISTSSTPTPRTLSNCTSTFNLNLNLLGRHGAMLFTISVSHPPFWWFNIR